MTDLTLLDRARALYDERQYAQLDELLRDVDMATLEAAPYLGFWLADAWRRTGKQPAALQLLEKIAPAARRAAMPRLELDRLNMLGVVQFETGNIPAAESTWRQLLSVASGEADDDFVARANNNLGIIYTLQARVPEAVMCYQRSLSAFRKLGARRGLAQSHQNLGITYRELERFDDADDHFQHAIKYASESDSADEIARAEQERALLIYLARRDGPLARVTVLRAANRFSAMDDPTGASDATRVLAMIELGEGDIDNARRHSTQALQHARAVGHTLLEAELLEVLAAAARKAGDDAVAAEMETQADAAFMKVHAPAWGECYRKTTARL